MHIQTQDRNDLYTWLRTERVRRSLSQSKLSRLTRLTQAQLSAWEHGKAYPSQVEEQEIRKALIWYDDQIARGVEPFPPKTKWSKEFHSARQGIGRKDAISEKEARAFVASLQPTQCEMVSIYSRAQTGTKAISLFSGCGGLTLGFIQAGFNVAGHIEIETAARKVFKGNFPWVEELAIDITQFGDKEASARMRELGPVDLIFGGPPCQGFSLTGKRDVYDPRNQLYKHFARLVRIAQPQAFVLENVRLLTTMKTASGGLLLDDLVETFKNLGYSIQWKILNAQSFGVPQFRERLFIVGLRLPKFHQKPQHLHPEETHAPSDLQNLLCRRQRFKTLREAIGQLEYLEAGEKSKSDPLHFAVDHPSHVIEMLKHVPEGRSAHENEDPALRPRSGYNTTYKRLRWDDPSSTISTTFGMISGSCNVHPIATRSLTIREAARCQTFPDDFLFFGRLGEIRTMIGNAVPPRLARAVGSHLHTLLAERPLAKSVAR